MAAGHHSIIGSRAYKGVHVHVNMTSQTGKYIKFLADMNSTTQNDVVVDWGDGSTQTYAYTSTSNTPLDHTYAAYGEYEIVMYNHVNMGFRTLDGQAACTYDPAIVSIVDYSGYLGGSKSGAFKGCANFKCFIAPKAEWMGQRDFANCPNFEEFVAGPVGIYYDGTFQNCSKLTKFTVDYSEKPENSAQCWHNVWNGCSSLVELRMGNINQIGNNCFANCPSLADVYIDNHTVAEIKNSFGKSYKFPWGAGSSVRFHGTNGYVLGNGTIVAG